MMSQLSSPYTEELGARATLFECTPLSAQASALNYKELHVKSNVCIEELQMSYLG